MEAEVILFVVLCKVGSLCPGAKEGIMKKEMRYLHTRWRLRGRLFEMPIHFSDPLFVPLFRRNLGAHKAARTPEKCREHSIVGKESIPTYSGTFN